MSTKEIVYNDSLSFVVPRASINDRYVISVEHFYPSEEIYPSPDDPTVMIARLEDKVNKVVSLTEFQTYTHLSTTIFEDKGLANTKLLANLFIEENQPFSFGCISNDTYNELVFTKLKSSL